MPHVLVNGVNHYYEWVSSKTTSEAPKPVMVFVHGWAGSARYWESTALAQSEQFDCLLYDMRGFGRSHIKEDSQELCLKRGYELETFADDLAALLDALGLERVYLNAHSMGASVAVFFLNRYPERVIKAILTCNGVFDYDEKAFNAFYQFGGYVVKFRPTWLAKIPLMSRFFMARFLHRPIPGKERQAFLEDFLNADYGTALGTIFTSVSKKATEVMPQEFSQIRVPTLMVSGQYDKITPSDLGMRASTLSSCVEYIEIPRTSHFPMLEDPKTYLAQVRSFLAG
ncbi:MAG TPA: alpha/beta hydrolase [Trichocoleus sp.]